MGEQEGTRLRRLGRRTGGRLSSANVTATLALIVALGTGGAFAASQIGPKDIAKNAVRAKHIKKNAVTTPKIRDGAVTTPKIGDSAVTTPKIGDSAVTTPKIGDGAVTAAKLATSEPYREVGTPGEPTFQNEWSNIGSGGSTAAFYKDPLGVVHLKGNVVNPASTQSVAFTLPPDYRPAQQLFLPVAAAGAGNPTGSLVVLPTGDVLPGCEVVNCSIGFDGLTFRVP